MLSPLPVSTLLNLDPSDCKNECPDTSMRWWCMSHMHSHCLKTRVLPSPNHCLRGWIYETPSPADVCAILQAARAASSAAASIPAAEHTGIEQAAPEEERELPAFGSGLEFRSQGKLAASKSPVAARDGAIRANDGSLAISLPEEDESADKDDSMDHDDEQVSIPVLQWHAYISTNTCTSCKLAASESPAGPAAAAMLLSDGSLAFALAEEDEIDNKDDHIGDDKHVLSELQHLIICIASIIIEIVA